MDILTKRKDYLETIIKSKEKSLMNAPSGTLKTRNVNGKFSYYERIPGEACSVKYLGKSKQKQIAALAQKNYDQEVLRSAKRELRIIEEMLEKYPRVTVESIYFSLCPAKQKYITPLRIPDEEFIRIWETVEYEHMGFRDQETSYMTDRGEKVRSKSELIIANILYKAGIPYRYEYPITLKGIGTIHPDFTALNVRLRREFYIEHLGMMDNPGYMENALKKINTYEKNGIYQGEQLIVTFETRQNSLDVKQISSLLEHFLT